MEECWCRLSLPTIKKDLIEKWYACIYFLNKSASLYITRMKTRFLNDKGGMILTLELDCLECKLGIADNILWEAKRKDADVFPLKYIVCEPLQMNPLRGWCWKCPSYKIVIKHFEERKKLETCYNHGRLCHETSYWHWCSRIRI